MFLEAKARDILSPIIQEIGEIYEQPFQNRILYLFHVLNTVDAREGDDDWPEEGLVYHFEGVKGSLFRLPWGSLCAVSGLTPPELDFKHVVETNNLTGLLFREVWDSESFVPPPTQQGE